MTEQEDMVDISFATEKHDEDIEDPEQKNSADPHKIHGKKKHALKKLQDELEETSKSLEATIAERDEMKDKYLRTLAEIDNFRKRVKKEKEDYQKYVLSEFLLDLLQVYDNLERALKAKTPSEKKESILTLLVSDDEKSIISGVEMIYKQFSDILKKYNVIEIEALNKPFDPNLHQALSKDESPDITEPMVVEVYQKGFMYNGKLLKPTVCKVTIPAPQKTAETDNNKSLNNE